MKRTSAAFLLVLGVGILLWYGMGRIGSQVPATATPLQRAANSITASEDRLSRAQAALEDANFGLLKEQLVELRVELATTRAHLSQLQAH
jgi:hypothetical protein